MPTAYRSILQVAPSESLLEDVDGLVGSWLESKSLPRLGTPQLVRVGSKQLARTDAISTGFRARRWELKETWDTPRDRRLEQLDGGAAVTSITVVQGATAAWVWVDIDSPRVRRLSEDGLVEIESQHAGTPRILSEILDSLAPTDGKAEMYNGALRVSNTRQLKEVLAVLTDESRIGAAFVSSPPSSESTDEWVTKVDSIIAGTEGMGVAYVVAPDLLGELNQALGFHHRVRPGGLRTFLPGAVPFDSVDAYRHRALAPATVIASHPRRLAYILRASQISRLKATRLPFLLQAADYELLRQYRLQPLANLESIRERSVEAGRSDDTAALKALNAELVAALEMQRGDAVNAVGRVIDLEDELLDEREINDLLGLELEESEDRREEATDLVRALRTRLRELEAWDAADAPLADEERVVYPDSFAELLERIIEFEFVTYVGRKANPLQLDEHPNIRPAVHKAWDALATLNDYARLSMNGDYDKGLMSYLTDGGHGGVNRLRNFKPNEGEVVQNNPKLSVMREVAVPDLGTVVFTSHVGLLNKRARAPRMYFDDRVASHQTVFIGYIGEHLVNAKLN